MQSMDFNQLMVANVSRCILCEGEFVCKVLEYIVYITQYVIHHTLFGITYNTYYHFSINITQTIYMYGIVTYIHQKDQPKCQQIDYNVYSVYIYVYIYIYLFTILLKQKHKLPTGVCRCPPQNSHLQDHPGFLWTIDIPPSYFGARNIQAQKHGKNGSTTQKTPFILAFFLLCI